MVRVGKQFEWSMMVFVFPPRKEDWPVPASSSSSFRVVCCSLLLLYLSTLVKGQHRAGTRTSQSRYYLAMPRPSRLGLLGPHVLPLFFFPSQRARMLQGENGPIFHAQLIWTRLLFFNFYYTVLYSLHASSLF